MTHHVLNFTGGAAHHRASSSSNTDVLAERMDRHVCSPGILLPCVAIAVCCHKSSISFFTTNNFVTSTSNLTGPPGPESTWAARLENIKQHASNLTHVSPCIYALEPDGSFGVQTGGGEQGNYSDIAPHIPALQAMGLKIIPIIYNIGGASGTHGCLLLAAFIICCPSLFYLIV